jgi:hypothetical protein
LNQNGKRCSSLNYALIPLASFSISSKG